jgi:glycosyltransferase involved in cell wall biosynthesis
MPTIGVAIICKNESVLLSRCLDSVKGLDGIFISDTGSTDNTVEIAKKYTSNVWTENLWEDDFAKARNFIKSKVTTDWILSLDCDEVLQDVSAVREAVALAETRHALAVDCTCIAEDNGQFFYYPRLFKNSPQVWWEGAIHNTLSVLGEKLGNVRITVGYSPAHKNDPDRSFRILKKDVEEHFHPRAMFYLGREYWYRHDYENCVIMMGKYVQVSTFMSEKADAFLIMARSYWAMGMGDDARDSCVQALIINATYKEAILFMAEIAGDGRGNERWQKNADMWKHMADFADNSDVLFVRP